MIASLKKLSQELHLDLTRKSSDNNFHDYPLLVTENFVRKMRLGDSKDPLLLQVLPQEREFKNIPGFTVDPLLEQKSSPIAGLVHKYYGRVLLLVTDVCAINCRFCFRRHLHKKITDWPKIFSYIENDSTISEAILSGGDPLMLKPRELKKIISRLASIPHIKRIRIHSRIPIVSPEKVKIHLLQAQVPVVIVIHCNHPNEINVSVNKALRLLHKQNITVFNQSVLLRNINDNAKILITLSEKLFNVGVMPYYLHILDKVKGAAHFYVDIKRARKIYRELQKKLPGYLVPKLVVESGNGKRHL